MEQQRTRNQDRPDRSSATEQADNMRDGLRDRLRDDEAIRNQDGGKDLGSSSDRAMFDDQDAAEERDTPARGSGRSESER